MLNKVRFLQISPAHATPQGTGTMLYHRQQRALHANGVIDTRRHMARGIVVIDNIDAADESAAIVYRYQLAMHTAQAAALECPRRYLGAEELHLDTRSDQLA